MRNFMITFMLEIIEWKSNNSYIRIFVQGTRGAQVRIFSCPKGSSIDDEVTGGAGAAGGAAVLRKSSLEASQGQETAEEDQGRSGEAQGSESSLPSSSKDGRRPQISNFKTDLALIEDDLVT